MKKITLILCFFSVVAIAQQNPEYALNQIIVKFKSNQNKALNEKKLQEGNLLKLAMKYGVNTSKLTGNQKLGNTFILNFENKSKTSIQEIITSYQATGMFEYVEPNYIGRGHGYQTTPNDTFYNNQWSHDNDGTFSIAGTPLIATANADIDTDLAWDITQGDPNLIVAVLDTGLKLDHPEFSGRIWNNTGETVNGTDSDMNNYIDDINGGWDFANNDNDPTDDNGHGTNVAGIALATGNNNTGYAGVNWNSKVMICKILDDTNNGFYSWWAEAMYYAVDNGAAVLNMSVGGNSPSQILKDALDYAYANDVAVVVSSGNQNSVIQYPAKYANAFAIGSTNPDDTRSVPFFWNPTSGSNFGPELDFVAPGNYMFGLKFDSNTDYNTYWGGTSQAAPLVTGVISLLLSVNNDLTVDQIRSILEDSSQDQVGDVDDISGWDQYYGHGRINANAALNASSTLSVEDVIDDQSSKISVYPIPVSYDKELTIKKSGVGVYEVVIYTMQGVKKQEFFSDYNDNDIRIPVTNLTSGTYLIQILDQNRQITVNKTIVVQ